MLVKESSNDIGVIGSDGLDIAYVALFFGLDSPQGCVRWEVLDTHEEGANAHTLRREFKVKRSSVVPVQVSLDRIPVFLDGCSEAPYSPGVMP